MHYLYKITNRLSGKVYIGQTIDIKGRWSAHKTNAKIPEKTGQYIHRAMAKYGVENFTFEVIATCRTQDDADETEDMLILQCDSRNNEHGYNLMIGGSHGGHSQETRRKMSESKMGEKNHQYGTKHTNERKQYMSAKLTGQKRSEETKKKMSESAKKVKHVSIGDGSRKLAEHVPSILIDTRSSRAIAQEYGVSKTTILRIKRNRTP